MAINERYPMYENPELLDRVIGYMQKGLADNLGWLDVAFGRAERVTRLDANQKKYYTPTVYAGGNEYLDVLPDVRLGNFCFFWVPDPQNILWEPGVSIGIKCPFAIIFWLDYRKVFNDPNIRNKEQIKKEILDLLNGQIWIKAGAIKMNKIYELAENIYKEFTVNETDNCFLLHPFGGFRFEGVLEITENCIVL